MKRVMLVLLCTLLGSLLILMLGCDKDDDVTGNDNTTLTPEDSSMIEDALLGDLFDTPLQSLEISLVLLDYLPEATMPKMSNPAAALGTDDEVLIIIEASYQGYSEGWHIFNFHARVTDQFTLDTVDIVGTDSVQIIEDGAPVRYPGSGTVIEGLKECAHADWWTNTDDTGAVHHRLEIDLDTSLTGDMLVTVNGTVDDYLNVHEEDDDWVCDIELGLDQVITDIVFNVDQESDCPESGQIVQIVTIDIHCAGEGPNAGDTMDINGVWTVTATVNEGEDTVTITFSNGIISWTVVEPCDGGGISKSGWID